MFTGSFLNYFYTMFLGIIDAVTSIIPGLSGTVIFMMLGVYEFVLDILSNPFSLVFIIYGIGLIIGIIFTCYLMNYLFKKHKDFTYQFIFIMMFCSIISLLLSLELTNIYLLFIFVIGIIFGYLIDK